jgi:hypothetical protein
MGILRKKKPNVFNCFKNFKTLIEKKMMIYHL